MSTVNVYLEDFVANPLSVKQVVFKPTGSAVSVSGDYIITADEITKYTNTSGLITLTNIVGGYYNVVVSGARKKTEFNILVPSDTNTYNAKDLLANVTSSINAANLFYITASHALELPTITTESGSTYIGSKSAGNYIKIGADGFLTLWGDAVTWDDLRVEPVAKGIAGARTPTFDKWFGSGSSVGVNLYTMAVNKDLYFTVQMPHAWMTGSDLHLHVHWIGSATGTPTQMPAWKVELTQAEVGGVFGNTTTITGSTTKLVPDMSNVVTASRHYITPFEVISPLTSDIGVSTVFIGRIYRDSAVDTYAGNCGMLYVDCHYQVNSMGSNTEYTKG